MWLVTCEILVEPGDMPSGFTKGFLNIATWAGSTEEVREKLSHYLDTFRWHLLSITRALPIDDSRDYGDEINDMIERASTNPQAIILGTFYSYKEN
jgi:hypothetical protein